MFTDQVGLNPQKHDFNFRFVLLIALQVFLNVFFITFIFIVRAFYTVTRQKK